MDSSPHKPTDIKNVLDTGHAAEHAGSTELTHVHVTHDVVASFELTPPHPPRKDTAAYRASHHNMVYVDDLPCAVCGVRNSTLSDPTKNIFNAKCLETHHYPIERSLIDACDPKKIGKIYATVVDRESLEYFIDSEQNLILLCDLHHRSLEQGIHHLLAQDFAVLPYLYDHYQIVAKSADAAKSACAANDLIEKQNGLEQ